MSMQAWQKCTTPDWQISARRRRVRDEAGSPTRPGRATAAQPWGLPRPADLREHLNSMLSVVSIKEKSKIIISCLLPMPSPDDHDRHNSNDTSASSTQPHPEDTSAPPARNDDQNDEPPPNLSPAQLAQRQRKINTLRESISDLESQIAQTESQLAETKSKLKSDEPAKTVQRHIRLLHAYNEIKDVGQGLMGLIADARGVRQVDVQSEFGVAAND
ncbi:hypothetical protein VTN00DRAFT_1054 [Thermoascus crustaceus]|uniref:uncharacterized protein n=1 Tax=Thermoascus crustaceus TaxID=5088 RepID=UPI003743F6CE